MNREAADCRQQQKAAATAGIDTGALQAGDKFERLCRAVVLIALAAMATARFPANDKYQLESAYGYSTVGTILEAKGELANALDHYRVTERIKSAHATAFAARPPGPPPASTRSRRRSLLSPSKPPRARWHWNRTPSPLCR